MLLPMAVLGLLDLCGGERPLHHWYPPPITQLTMPLLLALGPPFLQPPALPPSFISSTEGSIPPSSESLLSITNNSPILSMLSTSAILFDPLQRRPPLLVVSPTRQFTLC
ncbi:hypothetical protein FRB93_004377 [Tulasnella sp. JGI-2019a]|nr:hypothetical protein FRB93_004377 [Tulasnella sp. JGI-2019a]